MSPFDQYLGFFEREDREDRKEKREGWREGGREGNFLWSGHLPDEVTQIFIPVGSEPLIMMPF